MCLFLESSQSEKNKWKEWKLILHWSQSMAKQFSLQIALNIKGRFNEAVSSYFFTSIVCIFILFLGGFITANKEFSMVCLNQVVLGTATVGFFYCNKLPLSSPMQNR